NLTAGSSGVKMSQRLYAASHSASIDIFDSLGSKHTVKIDFTKAERTSGGGSSWDMKLSLPKPASFTGEIEPFENMITTGSVTFDNTGSLASFNPPSFTFSPNNGAEPDQTVVLDYGAGDFDGVTSFNKESSNGGITQDGYTGGDLLDIRIDQSGTLIGSFSNGRSFGLAQLSMAKFANNQGLANDGGNMFVQSANSGDPIVGTAATGGKGIIRASTLEMSNVDLSRSLTKLITVQRGFQANSKTITTSDQMLETLLGLKR
ncbi:MAG: flagellar hook-basal body complex protein, partial [Campylobacterota bacterium]